MDLPLLDTYIFILLVATTFVSLAVLTFYLRFTFWWWTKSGIATAVMSTAWVLVFVHFLLEALLGQNQVMEAILITFVFLATSWNGGTMVWKQYWWDEEEARKIDEARWAAYQKKLDKRNEKRRRRASH